MIPFFSQLRVRIVGLVLLAVIPALGLLLYSTAQRRQQDAATVQENALRLSKFVTSNLNRDIEGIHGLLSALAQLPFLHRENNAHRCNDFFSHLLQQSPVYTNIGIANTGGEIICSGLSLPQGVDLSTSNWFHKARKDAAFVIGYDLERRLSKRVTMTCGYPLVDSSGEAQSILFIALDLQWLDELAAQAQLPIGSALTVTSRDGTALVRYPDPEKWVGRSFTDVPLVRTILTRGEGVAEAPGMDGIPRLYAFSTVKDGYLTVRIGIRKTAAYAAANRSLVRNLAAMGLVTLLALGAAWFGGDWVLLRQVEKLVRATKRLAGGELGTRSNLSHDAGELGQLARAFDEMAESLQWRDAQLRESEAERWNAEMRFTEVMEVTADAILVLDGSLTVVFFNKGAEKLFGYQAREILGRNAEPLGLDRFRENSVRPLLDLSMASEETLSTRAEILGRRKDGTDFFADGSLSKLTRSGRTTITIILHEAVGNSSGSPIAPGGKGGYRSGHRAPGIDGESGGNGKNV